jgi:hypothetical protein
MKYIRAPPSNGDENMNTENLEEMVAGFITCGLWSESAYLTWNDDTNAFDEDTESDTSFQSHNFDADDIAPESLAAITADCAMFLDINAKDLANINAEQAGHDFWLTRNGHGAGFWDRGLGAVGERLTASCKHDFGECGFWYDPTAKNVVLEPS